MAEFPAAKEIFGLRGNVFILPNGFDPKLLALKTEEEDYMLFLGRFHINQKGLDTLSEAMRLVGCRLVIVGGGKDEERVRTLFGDSVAEGRTEFVGYAWGGKKEELMRKCLFMVVHSRYEGQPLIIMDTAACGKRAVVSDIQELRHAVDAGFGLPLEAGNTKELAEKIIFLLNNSSQRQEMGIKASKVTSYYTHTNHAPVKSLAKSCTTGHATNIIQGFAVGYESTVAAIIVIAVAIMTSVLIYSGMPPLFIAYGIAMTGIDAPFFEFLTLFFLLRLSRYGRLRDAFWAGLSIGLGLIFCNAFRLFLTALVIFVLAACLLPLVDVQWRRWWAAFMPKPAWPGHLWRVAALTVAVWLVIMPVVKFALNDSAAFRYRTNQISILTRRDQPDLSGLRVLFGVDRPYGGN